MSAETAGQRVAWPCPLDTCSWEFDTASEAIEHVAREHTCQCCGQAIEN